LAVLGSTSRALRTTPQAAPELVRELIAPDADISGARGEAARGFTPADARRQRPVSTPTGARGVRRRPVTAEPGDVQRWRAVVVGRLVRRLIGRGTQTSTKPVEAVWWSEALAGERASRALLEQ